MPPSPNQNSYFAAQQQRSRLPDVGQVWRWVGRDESGLAVIRSQRGDVVRAWLAGNAAVADGQPVLYVPPGAGEVLGQVQLPSALDLRRERPAIEEALFCAPLPILPCGENRLLSSGALQLRIDDNTGAISEVLFGGSDWYNPGAIVSDFAIAIDGVFDIVAYTRFVSATADVCGDSSRIVAENFSGNIDYEIFPMFREYQLVGDAAFRVDTYIANTSSEAALIEVAETFDPDQDVDQGGEFETFNRLRTIQGNRVTQAKGIITDYTVIMGSPEESMIVHDGNSFDFRLFRIQDLVGLQQFLDVPTVVETAGAELDEGIHCGLRQTVPPGGCFRFTMIQGFGTTIAAAEQAFLNAI